MKKFLRISCLILIFLSFGLGFWLGMKWQRFNYVDKCLDMGGGVNYDAGGICVLKK
jgi:hypothetical protein